MWLAAVWHDARDSNHGFHSKVAAGSLPASERKNAVAHADREE